MKHTLLVLLFVPLFASAQRHNLFADAGISFQGPSPGFSITYNYKLLKRLGVGIGVQGYSFSATTTDVRDFTPALYGDMRFNFRHRKKGMYFLFLDLGIDFYRRPATRSTATIIETVAHDNGTYFGLGYGYMRRITKRGGGPYGSLKLISNTYKVDDYNTASKKTHSSVLLSGTLALSVGFRF